MTDEFLTRKELAARLRVHPMTVSKWSKLPGFPMITGRILWSDYLAWRQQQIEAKAAASAQGQPPACAPRALPHAYSRRAE